MLVLIEPDRNWLSAESLCLTKPGLYSVTVQRLGDAPTGPWPLPPPSDLIQLVHRLEDEVLSQLPAASKPKQLIEVAIRTELGRVGSQWHYISDKEVSGD